LFHKNPRAGTLRGGGFEGKRTGRRERNFWEGGGRDWSCFFTRFGGSAPGKFQLGGGRRNGKGGRGTGSGSFLVPEPTTWKEENRRRPDSLKGAGQNDLNKLEVGG